MTIKIIPKLIPITPRELYMQIVNSSYDNIRHQNDGMTYIPSQFGGIFGQGVILNQSTVMEITSFEVS